MIYANPKFNFSLSDYDVLKESLAFHLSEVKPSLRLEILARGIGYKTLASFQSDLKKSSNTGITFKLTPKSAIEFARTKSYSVESFSLFSALSTAAHHKIFWETPLLHDIGYGKGYFRASTLRNRKKADLAVLQNLPTLEESVDRELELHRIEKLKIQKRGGFLRALLFASKIRKIGSDNRRTSSYGLKHQAEQTRYCLPEKTILERDYVSNSDFIAAALYSGFQLFQDFQRDRYLNDSPNVSFNMSQSSIEKLL